ncbi:polysaccharide lyase, putative [Phytophthora infestans T30-4]|uniref:Polysaccharide lyase, putative n=1 Tax=Phytophthora infestans (strain T30-4) TaxID=403677 RepID=D0RM06_PHYIT|nr:polysaccharide lyase, putative [Phytophthora infestans T30-4]EEY56713.1 polysaccharide lyase, putative [Phytophthora infestans T30-4]|eukprot:XP_002909925.1 polysaccharide lyase, putative [Phytophthora infestans T30-4]
MTLSSAGRAPPPITLVTLLAEPPLMLSASSHTSSHHTFWIVQPFCSQCTPSIWSLPMITFLSVAPGSTMKTAVCHPLSFWPPHLTFERAYVFMPPSNVWPFLTVYGSFR